MPLPLTIQSVSGEPRTVKLGRDVLDGVLLGHLGDPAMSAVLTTAVAEDYSLLTPWVQSLYQDLEKGAGSLMARVMLCSVASGPAARQQASREAPATVLGQALDNGMQGEAFCKAFGVTPPATQPAAKARVSGLLISGRAAAGARSAGPRDRVPRRHDGRQAARADRAAGARRPHRRGSQTSAAAAPLTATAAP